MKQKVKAFIQNVHHFRDAGLRDSGPPVDHVVIFDEAQRAWNKEMTANFMLRKKKRPGFSQSEPEFQIQGLELDWVCVTWDADLRFADRTWEYHSFRGTQWTTVHKPDRRQYLRNAYRVLLTRARQGMVIFVPPGDTSDPTRTPALYDSTFEYLAETGIPLLKGPGVPN